MNVVKASYSHIYVAVTVCLDQFLVTVVFHKVYVIMFCGARSLVEIDHMTKMMRTVTFNKALFDMFSLPRVKVISVKFLLSWETYIMWKPVFKKIFLNR